MDTCLTCRYFQRPQPDGIEVIYHNDGICVGKSTVICDSAKGGIADDVVMFDNCTPIVKEWHYCSNYGKRNLVTRLLGL